MRGKQVVVSRGEKDKVAVELRDEAHLNELIATHGAANVLDANTNQPMQPPADTQPQPAAPEETAAPKSPKSKKKAAKKPAKKAGKKPAKKARK